MKKKTCDNCVYYDSKHSRCHFYGYIVDCYHKDDPCVQHETR